MPWSLSLSVPEVEAGVNALALTHSREVAAPRREMCILFTISCKGRETELRDKGAEDQRETGVDVI